MNEIVECYFAMIPVRTIKGEILGKLTYDDQKILLSKTLQHEISQNYQPSCQYRKSFLKYLIDQGEKYWDEVHDELYEEYTTILSLQDTDTCYKTYTLTNGNGIVLRESTNLISQGTTGLCTWQAAQCLSEWAIENRDLIENKCVFELGSGLGLTGLVTIKECRPKHFTFSDCHHQVLELLKHNIDLNASNTFRVHAKENTSIARESTECSTDSLSKSTLKNVPSPSNIVEVSKSSKKHSNADSGWKESFPDSWDLVSSQDIRVVKMDWENISEQETNELLNQVDVLLAADVVYDICIIPALVRILSIYLNRDGTRCAYIASTVRNEATRDEFLSALVDSGLKWSTLPSPRCAVFRYDKSTPIQIIKVTAVG